VIPLCLRLEDFRSFREAEIDLSGLGLVGVAGRNGSGKSALLEAMIVALYGRSPRASRNADAPIREGSPRYRVILDFEAKGRVWRVERVRARGGPAKTKLFQIADNEISATAHTQRETTAAIVDLVGLDLDAMLAGPVMLQRDDESLVRRDPGPAFDLLSRLLLAGVDWTGIAEQTRSDAKAAASVARSVAAEVTRLEAEAEGLGAIEQAVGHERDVVAVQERGVAEADRAVRDADTKIATLSAQASMIEQLDSDLAMARSERSAIPARTRAVPEPKPPYAGIDLDERRRRAEALRDMADAADRTQAETEDRLLELADAQATAGRFRMTLLHLEKECARRDTPGLCDHCPFVADAPTREQVDAVRKALTNADAYAASLASDDDLDYRALAKQHRDEATGIMAAVDAIDRARRDYDAAHAVWAAKDAERRAANAAADERAAGLERTIQTLEQRRAGLGDVAAQLEAMRADRSRAEIEYLRATDTFGATTGRLSKLEGEHATKRVAQVHAAEARARSITATRDARIAGHLARAFARDGIPSRLVAGAVPLVEHEANALLALMPGGMAVEIRTERETKEGASVGELNIRAHVFGRWLSFADLSGAQQSCVSLAVRLSEASVVAARRGASVDFFWVDEADAYFDDETTEAWVEAVASLRGRFPLGVLSSHDAALVGRMEHRIDLTLDDNLSSARVIR
jgi:DNA repair exonuclease SbcCD ATPase subunit